MKRLKLIAASTAVTLIFAAGGWWYVHSKNSLKFQTASVERGDIQASISATGNTNAVVDVQVGSQVSGNIQALYADFNTKVHKGQLVATIDPQIFQARVDQARANLDSANAAVVSARAGLVKADADIASAQANLANAKANLVKAQSAEADGKIKYDRRAELGNQKIISRDDLDTARATYEQAVAMRQAAEAQVSAADHQAAAVIAQRDVASTQLSSAQAQVKQMAASLEQAAVDLEHTRITAPVDGTVIARRMDVGQTVAASFQAPTIFEIAQDLTKMQVDTSVDEADIGKVKLGEQARFTVDAFPGRVFHGAVTQIRQAPINVQNVITYDVVIAVANPDQKLLPGMTASVKVFVDAAKGVLKVLNSALRYKPADAMLKANDAVEAAAPQRGRGQQSQKSVLWVLGKDGPPRSIRVELGLSDGLSTAVTNPDLHEGDQLIVADSSTAAKRTSTSTAGARRGGPGF